MQHRFVAFLAFLWACFTILSFGFGEAESSENSQMGSSVHCLEEQWSRWICSRLTPKPHNPLGHRGAERWFSSQFLHVFMQETSWYFNTNKGRPDSWAVLSLGSCMIQTARCYSEVPSAHLFVQDVQTWGYVTAPITFSCLVLQIQLLWVAPNKWQTSRKMKVDGEGCASGCVSSVL